MCDDLAMNPRDETRHDTTGATGRDTTTTEMVASVSEAARLLGISEGAVRKRIERGQLRAAKFKNQWQITIGSDDLAETALRDATRRDETGRDTTDTTDATGQDATRQAPGGVAPAAVAQLEAIRDQWLRPLVDRIGELEREAGRLQAEREAARRERDDLAARVADDRKLADQLVDVLQHERDAAVKDRDRVAARLAEGERWVEVLTARVRELEAAASELPAETESRRLSGPAAPISPPAWRVWPPPSEKSPRRPRWRFWERWR